MGQKYDGQTSMQIKTNTVLIVFIFACIFSFKSNAFANEELELNKLISDSSIIAEIKIVSVEHDKCGRHWTAKVLRGLKGINDGESISLGHAKIYILIDGRYLIFASKEFKYSQTLRSDLPMRTKKVPDENDLLGEDCNNNQEIIALGIYSYHKSGYKKDIDIVLIPNVIKLPPLLMDKTLESEVKKSMLQDENSQFTNNNKFIKFVQNTIKKNH